MLYNTTFTDIYSCYFAFKKELLDANFLQTSGFEQHAEIICKVIKKGKKFYEVPINYNGRSYSEGKKNKTNGFFFNYLSNFLKTFILEYFKFKLYKAKSQAIKLMTSKFYVH